MDLSEFLDAAAAKRPDPGGGAAAAVAGALAAAMGAMALRYSLRRKDARHHAAHEAAVAEFDRLRASLTRAIDADQVAYAALVEARRSGGDVAAAARSAVAVPAGIARDAAAVLATAAPVAETCNPWLLSDLGVCCDLAMACVRCGVWNVRANLPDLPAAEAPEAERRAEALERDAIAAVTRTSAAIHARTP